MNYVRLLCVVALFFAIYLGLPGLLVNRKDELSNLITNTLQRQHGVLFAQGESSFVHRVSYTGRSIIKPNSNPALHADSRGYVPVELWIMSITPAENEVVKPNEGLTMIKLTSSHQQSTLVSLREAIEVYGDGLVGPKSKWPLTKILDIGGEPVVPDFGDRKGEPEIPPIPCHIHRGYTTRDSSGKLRVTGLPGKNEAYFFPPLNLPPYNNVSVDNAKTRLGFKHGVTKDQVVEKLKRFGVDDSFYDLLTSYEVKPYEGWTIQPGILHAPGPYITFEIQYPQDDFHFASWRLGEKLKSEKQRTEFKESLQLRNLRDESEFLDVLIDWEATADPKFQANHHRPSKVLEQGQWGRRLQIFFDEFYGEGFEVEPGQTMTHKFDKAFAGLVWSGQGAINNNPLSATDQDQREFLVVPNTPIRIHNSGSQKLVIWTVFPLLN